MENVQYILEFDSIMQTLSTHQEGVLETSIDAQKLSPDNQSWSISLKRYALPETSKTRCAVHSEKKGSTLLFCRAVFDVADSLNSSLARL